MLCEIKVVEFALDLDVTRKKLSHCQRNCFLWFRPHRQVHFGLVNTTSNDLLRAQADVEKYFRSVFYYIYIFFQWR